MATQSLGDIYIAVNMSKVLSSEQSFEVMRRVGPKICTLTASNPGFLGYQAHYQIGALPMIGRYGGADLHMERTLNPIRNYQYTVWQGIDSHTEFHRDNLARMIELCYACLSVTVEGPWEPVCRIVAAQMPQIRSLGQAGQVGQPQARQSSLARLATPMRCIVITEVEVKPEQRSAYEQGAVATMDAISDSPGFLGYMLLDELGVNPYGSFMLDPGSMMELLETFGAHPPSDPKPLFDLRQAAPTPPRYYLHSEWETPEMAQAGMTRVVKNHAIRTLHNQRVMQHLIRGPYSMIFRLMDEEPSWRQLLP